MAKRPELPENLLALTEPALPDADISSLCRLIDADPVEFQKAAAKLFKRLAVEGFRTIQAPRNYKELSTVVDLWRKLEGLDKQDKGGGMPAGLVGVLRGVNRRIVEVEPVDDDPGFT